MGSTGGGSRGGRSKSGKYTGGGLTLFETRIESNMDIYDGIRHTIPYIDHHHNMIRWDIPKVKEKKVKNFVSVSKNTQSERERASCIWKHCSYRRRDFLLVDSSLNVFYRVTPFKQAQTSLFLTQ